MPVPAHTLTHEPTHHASLGGHMRRSNMNVDCVVLLALRIEGAPRPAPGAGRLDFENQAITHLFSGDAMSDPCVAGANLGATGCDMNPGLTIGAGPIAEIRLARERGAARADRHERRQSRNPS